MTADPFSVKQRPQDGGGTAALMLLSQGEAAGSESSPSSAQLWSAGAGRPVLGCPGEGGEEQQWWSLCARCGEGRPVLCSVLTPTRNLGTKKAAGVCSGAGSHGDRRHHPQTKGNSCYLLQAPEILGAQFFQILPCLMSCQKSRPVYGISPLCQYQQLRFSKSNTPQSQIAHLQATAGPRPPLCQVDIISQRWVTPMCYRWGH